jgi:tetratricopeptide (TPR) repeat protein
MSAQLASHYDRAGAVREAIRWYAIAAEEAQRMHASSEAVRLLNRAVELVRTLPETRDRHEHELALLTALLVPLGNVGGWVSDGLTEPQLRAHELSRRVGVEPAPTVLRSLALTTLSQGRFEEARDVGRQLHLRAERDEDEMVLVEGHYVHGISTFWQGELEAAQGHFEAAVARYRPEYRATHLAQFGQDPKVICLSRLANTLWFLGRPAAAAQARDSAFALAEEIGDPESLGITTLFAALLALDLRDEEALRAYTETLQAWRRDHEARPLDVTTEALAGYVDVLDGRQDGLARIRQAVDDSHVAEHAPGQNATMVRILLEACLRAHHPSVGLAAAELRLGAGGGAALWDAEFRRLRAEFLATLCGPPEEIEAELERAAAVAARQGARSLELRAASSLLRRRIEWRDVRGVRDARDRLDALLHALPEPQASRDRDEAEALLRDH